VTSWGIVSRRKDVVGKVEASKDVASKVGVEFRKVFIVKRSRARLVQMVVGQLILQSDFAEKHTLTKI
jgi:hypothetical protein